MNHHQYKQLIQTAKNQYNKIKSLENELTQHKANTVNFNNDRQRFISKVKELEEQNVNLKNQFEIQTKNNQFVTIKINELNKELEVKVAQLESANAQLESANAQLESANEKINKVTKELEVKSSELESANQKISEMTADLDKRNDTLYQIDKIILRNNDYFDEIKKELNHKIACGKEMSELYQNTNSELLRVRNEMELLCKELDATKTELHLYKNDFILKSATF
jgi:chromosome segregation ATPase